MPLEMPIDETRAWLALLRAPGLGAAVVRELVGRHGNACQRTGSRCARGTRERGSARLAGRTGRSDDRTRPRLARRTGSLPDRRHQRRLSGPAARRGQPTGRVVRGWRSGLPVVGTDRHRRRAQRQRRRIGERASLRQDLRASRQHGHQRTCGGCRRRSARGRAGRWRQDHRRARHRAGPGLSAPAPRLGRTHRGARRAGVGISARHARQNPRTFRAETA